VPSWEIKGLPIKDQSKVALGLAAGQGMNYEGDKLIAWQERSANKKHAVASKSHAPQMTKQNRADCSDYNCQYVPYFDGVNDYMKSSKKLEEVREMFIVLDLGDKIFNKQNTNSLPVVNFDQKAEWQEENYPVPTYWDKEGEGSNLSSNGNLLNSHINDGNEDHD